MACSGRSGARPGGCAPRRRAITGPWRQQAILGRGQWEADALRDVVRDYALETLADADGVLVIDETGFLKQGRSSCGAGRQYTGSVGKITNCQIGVFAAYVSRHGHGLWPRRSHRASIHPHGSVSPPARARKARAYTTGRISNWPISMQTNTGARTPACGPAAC